LSGRDRELDQELTDVIEFVGNIDLAVRFSRDTIGLPLKLDSPDWSSSPRAHGHDQRNGRASDAARARGWTTSTSHNVVRRMVELTWARLTSAHQ